MKAELPMVQLPAFKIKIYVEIVCETPGAAFVLSTVLDLSHSFPNLLLTMQVVMILSSFHLSSACNVAGPVLCILPILAIIPTPLF